MKIQLSKNVRIKRDYNYKLLAAKTASKYKMSNRVNDSELSALRDENSNLHMEDKAFREEAKKLLRTITPDTPLKVKTQIGKDSTIIHEYNGHIEKKFGYNDGHFNFISPDRDNECKPFTIGLSCLLSIEVIDRKHRIENLKL